MTEPGSHYELVPAISVEESRLVDFAAAVWPDEAPHFGVLSSWWRRAGSDCAVAAVHRPSGAMAGLCGGRPCTWSIEGASVPAIGICDWFVAPAHAGKGLGKRLVRHFEAPNRFIYAFSISDAAVAYLRVLGWEGPYASSLMVVPLPRIVGMFSRSAGDGGLAFDERDVAGAEPLGALGSDLDAIEAARGHAARAHMRRGAEEWAWRLSVCGKRRYRFCVARRAEPGGRAGRPVGYAVVRRMSAGRSRLMDGLKAAMITDLAAVDDDSAVLRVLARKAVDAAAAMQAHVVVAATTSVAHRRALAGFLSPALPLLGRLLARRSPLFMWRPHGPAAKLRADDMTLTFADVAIDLDL